MGLGPGVSSQLYTMKYIIDRKRWQRGRGAAESGLYLPENRKMCCLGQVAKQCGVSLKAMSMCGAPSSLKNESILKLPKWLYHKKGRALVDSAACGKAMQANDSEYVTDAGREKTLTALFAKHGDELVFIN